MYLIYRGRAERLCQTIGVTRIQTGVAEVMTQSTDCYIITADCGSKVINLIEYNQSPVYKAD